MLHFFAEDLGGLVDLLNGIGAAEGEAQAAGNLRIR